jgi:hypothetical protein
VIFRRIAPELELPARAEREVTLLASARGRFLRIFGFAVSLKTSPQAKSTASH